MNRRLVFALVVSNLVFAALALWLFLQQPARNETGPYREAESTAEVPTPTAVQEPAIEVADAALPEATPGRKQTLRRPEQQTLHGYRLTVTVLDEESRPLHEAVVRLWHHRKNTVAYERVTDARGEVAFFVPKYREHQVRITAVGYARGDFSLNWPETDLIARLTPKPRVTTDDGAMEIVGTVRDEDGRPLAEVAYYCRGCKARVNGQTDAFGRYDLEKVFEGARVGFTKKGYISAEINPYGAAYTDVVLRRAPRFVGRLVDETDGRPVEQFGFRLFRADQQFPIHSESHTRHAGGLFNIPSMPLDEQVLLKFDVQASAPIEVPFLFRAEMSDTPQDIVINRSRGQILVQVVDERHQPVKDAVFELHTGNYRGSRRLQNGFFQSDPLIMAHRYAFKVSAEGYISEKREDVVPTPFDAEAKPTVITLRRGTSLTVVVDQDQFPGASGLEVVSAKGVAEEAQERTKYVFHIKGLPPGPTDLKLSSSDQDVVTKTVHIEKVPEQEVTFGNPKRFTLTGVFSVQGKVANHLIDLVKKDERARRVACDEQGRFTIKHVSPGRYFLGTTHRKDDLFLSMGVAPPFKQEVVVEDGDLLDLVIDVPAGTTIRGCEPADTNLKLIGTMENGSVYQDLTVARKHGFLFANTPPGRYDIVDPARGPNGEELLKYADVEVVGGKEDIDLCETQKR
ncbi:hypothetical protein APED_07125 [Acanthopleuribacter pedis]